MYEMLEYLAVERIDSTNDFEHMNVQFTTRGCFRKMAQNDVMIVLSRIQQTVSISSFFSEVYGEWECSFAAKKKVNEAKLHSQKINIA